MIMQFCKEAIRLSKNFVRLKPVRRYETLCGEGSLESGTEMRRRNGDRYALWLGIRGLAFGAIAQRDWTHPLNSRGALARFAELA